MLWIFGFFHLVASYSSYLTEAIVEGALSADCIAKRARCSIAMVGISLTKESVICIQRRLNRLCLPRVYLTRGVMTIHDRLLISLVLVIVRWILLDHHNFTSSLVNLPWLFGLSKVRLLEESLCLALLGSSFEPVKLRMGHITTFCEALDHHDLLLILIWKRPLILHR